MNNVMFADAVQDNQVNAFQNNPEPSFAASPYVIRLTRVLDDEYSAEIKKQLMQAAAQGIRRIDIDMSSTPYATAAGAGMLVNACLQFQQAEANNQFDELRFINPNEKMAQLVSTLGLDNYICD